MFCFMAMVEAKVVIKAKAVKAGVMIMATVTV